ncbi:hypothetical protein K9N68_08225 [Kovacikia minuta CCNUW1]|uniref:hypothetical protein n=1 Tax=Kovacikia minuta TaxID=2931930 RepID=UPI001CCF8EEA|nr:hypothetical protein [Kovacikia minuta]UBF27872.1 hypothetical protein K9N68_08225 [Kovacikia minuta CCNUW1]
MLISMMQDSTTWLTGLTQCTDLIQTFHWHLPLELSVLDKPLEVDLGGDVQRAFNNFVKTGQVWAFLIGLVLGYLFKTFTSYG